MYQSFFIHQQMHFLLILENSKICIKSYMKIVPYMFRSTTIIRELTLVLT
jgi:hypothetical protein